MKEYKWLLIDELSLEDAVLTDGNFTISTTDAEETVDALFIQVDATHLNYINKNKYFYNLDQAVKAKNTWVSPFKKPVLPIKDAHNIYNGEPIGEVVKVDVVKLSPKSKSKPTAKLVLTLRIVDTDAIEKIKDHRYKTVSVGSVPKKVICSICGEDITDNLWYHKHERGKKYEGELCYWEVFVDEYREISFVNAPADATYTHAASISMIMGKELITQKDAEIKLPDYYKSKTAMLLADSEIEEVFQEEVTPTVFDYATFKDSDFCGPDRTFAAVDAPHILAGLRLLDRYNGPGSKREIRTSLLKKGKKLGMTFNDESQVGEKMSKTLEDSLREQLDASTVELSGVKEISDNLKAANSTLEDQVATLTQDSTDKDQEITQLKDELKNYQDTEKKELVNSLFELKVKHQSKDVSAFADAKEDEKADKEKEIKDSLMKLEIGALRFATETLSDIKEVEEKEEEPVSVETVESLDDAANDEEGNAEETEGDPSDPDSLEDENPADPIDDEIF